MLFNKSKKDILDIYANNITAVLDKTNTVVLADTDTSIGNYPKSDIILTFSPDDTLAIQTERVLRKNYKEKEWLEMVFATQCFAIEEDSRGIKYSVTYNVDYIDIVKYRKEWLDWAEEFMS